MTGLIYTRKDSELVVLSVNVDKLAPGPGNFAALELIVLQSSGYQRVAFLGCLRDGLTTSRFYLHAPTDNVLGLAGKVDADPRIIGLNEGAQTLTGITCEDGYSGTDPVTTDAPFLERNIAGLGRAGGYGPLVIPVGSTWGARWMLMHPAANVDFTGLTVFFGLLR